MFNIHVHACMDPGQRQITPWGQIMYINKNVLSIGSFAAKYSPFNDFLTVLSI